MARIIEVQSKSQFNLVRTIFREYADYINIDLSFQNFTKELKFLKKIYSPPYGCILLAFLNGKLAGCVGVRKIDKKTCEMKRLYVKESYRHQGIGKTLTRNIIDKARDMGYKYMRLDTLPTMKDAISLYSSFGFKEIKPYRFNPIKNAKFFELRL